MLYRAIAKIKVEMSLVLRRQSARFTAMKILTKKPLSEDATTMRPHVLLKRVWEYDLAEKPVLHVQCREILYSVREDVQELPQEL